MGVTSVRLTDELQDQLEETAERLKRSKGWIISEALAEFMEKEERALARIERTRQALDQVEAGQVVDGDEVMAWINSWGTENETRPPKQVKLEFTEQALDDLIRLREFIAEKNPAAAERVSQQLIESIQRLTEQPEIGHRVESLPGVQEWIAREYVVHYLVLNEALIVLQIWHGREDRAQQSFNFFTAR